VYGKPLYIIVAYSCCTDSAISKVIVWTRVVFNVAFRFTSACYF